MQDTIYAPSTPVGGAIAVIRISGPRSEAVLRDIFTGEIKHRTVSHGLIRSGAQTLDDSMAVFFRALHSYTGEDMAELFTHGGQAVVSGVLALLAERGLRIAQPGEFTRRAFFNGKLDLAQSEAVMDLVSATAQRGAQSALEQLQGRLSSRVHAIEETLLDALSGLDAAIDYPDEVEEDVAAELPALLKRAAEELYGLIEEGLRGRVLREGARVAILGKPNAGKSTLLNGLIGEERAIVTPLPGTTRDVIEAECAINGIAVRLLDTAGLRETDDLVEGIGIARAMEAMRRADLLLLAVDGAAELTAGDEAKLAEYAQKPCLLVVCKQDAADGAAAFAAAKRLGLPAYGVSALHGEGLAQLKAEIAKRIAPESESALVTNMRHVEALQNALGAVESAQQAQREQGAELDLVATDLRAALLSLGEITGSAVDAGVIDRIFARFCVGK